FSAANEMKCEVVGEKKYLPRRVSYPRFDLHPPVRLVATGEMQSGVQLEKLWKDRSLTNIGPQLGGYPEGELELVVSNDLQTLATKSINPVEKAYQWGQPVALKTNQHAIIDFGTNLSGFIGAKVKCAQKTRLVLTFDEILSDGDVDWKRLGCVNAVSYELEKGEYELESFEPYTLRYLKAIVLEGACEVESFYLRDYVNPDTEPAAFACSDVRLNQLFEAGRETFVQNAVDIFMDCPSRERAGWLCDSFFTSRVAFDLSRDCRVETNFYENFLMPDGFKHLPDGMLPMCYPADHNDGVFIPNWAMWFVIELDEYYQRSGDRAMVDALKPKIMKLLAYFKPFENEDGLLEKLQSWVFVEWSAANQFVQDVNYPSNMLYSGVLDVAGRLYGDDDLRGKAERIRETIRKQSFDGKFFIDNAVRENGKLKVTQNHSEVCQYFAFFFDVADAKTHPELWKTLRDEFGPQRKETKSHPEVHFANSFVGNVLRLEILSE
ncbi:family 78 glycoside hydrolase catalytic domain, partial [bacterium]|nr:family 78 glycoside hydrolase catalytic domain [bacterium]